MFTWVVGNDSLWHINTSRTHAVLKKYWRKTFYSSPYPSKKQFPDSKTLLKPKCLPQAFYFWVDQPKYPKPGVKKPCVSVICVHIEDVKHPNAQEEWSRGGREHTPTQFIFHGLLCRALPQHVSFVWRGISLHMAFCQGASVWSSEENGPSGPEFLSLSILSIWWEWRQDSWSNRCSICIHEIASKKPRCSSPSSHPWRLN